MATYLFLWVVVASGPYREWRNMGEFSSPEACVSAAAQLGAKPDYFRCVSKHK